MILRTRATIAPQHAYGIADRLLQISGDALNLNQGHHLSRSCPIRAARLDQRFVGQNGEQPRSEYCTITRTELKALEEETVRWRQMAGVAEKLPAEEQ